MFRRFYIIATVLSTACGSSGEPSSAHTKATPDPSTIPLTEDPMARTVVARVNGTPIYDDCVARQARAHEIHRRAALDECIDFELLAQAADAEGYRVAPEVLEARTTESARALIGVEFEKHFDGPEDIPIALVREAYEELKPQKWVHPELRTMQYVRVPLEDGDNIGGFRSLAGLAALVAVFEQLRGRTDVTGEELHARARAAAGDIPVESPSPLTFSLSSNIVPQYKRIVFEQLQTPGAISAPRRTQWGWDIVLLVEITPPVNQSFEQAEQEVREFIFKKARQRAFAAFLQKRAPANAEVSTYWLERLAGAARAEATLIEPVP